MESSWLPVDSYLQFDLREINLPHLEKARLRIFTNKGLLDAPLTVGVATVKNDTWTQQALTKKICQPSASCWIQSTSNMTCGVWLDFDVTDFVREQATGDNVVSLQLPLVKGEGFVGGYNSKAHGNAPVLILQTKPASNPGPPSAPAGIKTTAGRGFIALDCKDNPEDDVVSYNVYRRTSPTDTGDWRTPIATGLVTSDYRDVSLKEKRSN